MGLIWNTRELLADATSRRAQATEYHAAIAREAYDKTILTADRYSSGAAEWVVPGDRRFYTISVASRPFRATPQVLCLAFDCCFSSQQIGSGVSMGYSHDDTARDVFALLSAFVRAPIALLGARRLGDRPVIFADDFAPTLRAAEPIPPAGIDSREFMEVLRGLAQVEVEARANAALAAVRFYSSALLTAQHDVSTAYTSLVMALECLSGFHYKKRAWAFDETPKFGLVARKLKDIEERTPEHAATLASIRDNLVANESFIAKKVIELVSEFASDELWVEADERYPWTMLPAPERSALPQAMRQIYNARSQYVHAGQPFPRHVEVGRASRVDSIAAMEAMAIATGAAKGAQLPTFAWFERLTADVIRSFLRRSFAAESEIVRVRSVERKRRLREAIRALPEEAQKALQNLVSLTVPFLSLAVVNPHFKNSKWAHSIDTTELLAREGFVGGTGHGMEEQSWLLDREVGEAVGAELFGEGKNPFLGAELLLPVAVR